MRLRNCRWTRWIVACFAWAAVGMVTAACSSDDPEDAAQPTVTPDPVITLEHPLAGALVAGPTIEVSGVVAYSADDAMVVINGVSYPAPGGRFTVQLILEDGPQTISVSYEDASVQAAITVDGFAPALVLRGPARGTVTQGSAVDVALASFDENGLVRLEIDGQALDHTAGPEWTQNVALKSGLNTIHVEAEDSAGHISAEDFSVLAGPFGLPNALYPDAVVVHIGAEALAATGELVATAIEALDLTALAKSQNPIVDNDLVRIDVDTVVVAPGSTVQVIPNDNGITVRATITDLELAGELTLQTGSEKTYDAALTIKSILVEVPLVVIPTDGIFEASLAQPTFMFEEPKVTVQGGELGAELEGQVVDTVEELLTSVTVSVGGPAISAALARLTQPFTVAVPGFGAEGLDVSLQLTAASVDAGSHGLDLRLSGLAFVAGEPVKSDAIGVPRTPDQPAYHPSGPDVAIALSDDLVNGLLHALWRYGLTDLKVDNELMASTKSGVTLVAGFLGSVIDESVTDPEALMTVSFDAPLPPAIVPPPAGGAIAIGIGDLGLRFSTAAGDIATGFLNLRLAAGALSTDEGVLLDLAPYLIGFDLQVEDAAAKRRLEGTVEHFVTSLIGELAPLLKSLLGPVPLPSFAGLSLQNLKVGDDDTAGAYLVIRGTAVPAE
ncbi:MAG: hypothetical protein ACI9OJ_003190 [Myxococcota bacterium]|jgi:hypothetical protein